jgi:hypothetical protein
MPLYNRANGEAMEPIFHQMHRTRDTLANSAPIPPATTPVAWDDTEKNPWLSLKIIGDGAGVGRWQVRADKNPEPLTLNAAPTYVYRGIYCGNVTLGVWTDWVFCCRYDMTNGYLKAWKKLATEASFTQVVNVTGGVGFADVTAPYLKIGVYQSAWDNTSPVIITDDIDGNEIRTIDAYHDSFRFYAGTLGSDALGISYVKPR